MRSPLWRITIAEALALAQIGRIASGHLDTLHSRPAAELYPGCRWRRGTPSSPAYSPKVGLASEGCPQLLKWTGTCLKRRFWRRETRAIRGRAACCWTPRPLGHDAGSRRLRRLVWHARGESRTTVLLAILGEPIRAQHLLGPKACHLGLPFWTPAPRHSDSTKNGRT